MSRRSGKYLWCDDDFDKWCKEQSAKLKQDGIEIGSRGITRIIHKKIIIPNNISMTQFIVPTIKIKRIGYKRQSR